MEDVIRVRGRTVVVIALASQLVGAYPLAAQQAVPPAPPALQQPALPPYRAPQIALAQPAGGGAVPQDRPVVVFRFAQGEPADPLDSASFAVSVDGEDRTALFQRASSEAWGPLGAAAPNSAGAGGVPSLGAGAHRVEARVCSARGVCAGVTATVTVLPGLAAQPHAGAARTAATKAVHAPKRLVGVLLHVARELLIP